MKVAVALPYPYPSANNNNHMLNLCKLFIYIYIYGYGRMRTCMYRSHLQYISQFIFSLYNVLCILNSVLHVQIYIHTWLPYVKVRIMPVAFSTMPLPELNPLGFDFDKDYYSSAYVCVYTYILTNRNKLKSQARQPYQYDN